MSRPTRTTALVLGVFSVLWIALFPRDPGGLGFNEDNLVHENWDTAYHEHKAPDASVAHRHDQPSTCDLRFLEEDDFWRHGCQSSAGQALPISDSIQLPDWDQNFAPIPLLHIAPKNSPPSLFA
jgi:hypothetical protein